MIKGIGIDVIEIDRIREAVEKYGEKFLEKVYTPHEIKYCSRRNHYRIPELAVRFAAKEAYSKAVGTGISGFGRNNHGVKWTDVSVVNDKLGKPQLSINGTISEKVYVSLSHSRDFAIANVYVEK